MEINPEEYSRLQEAERQKQVLEQQMELRERQMEEASAQKVAAVASERDEAKQQMLQLRKDRLLERAFSQAEGRTGGDARGTFFDMFNGQLGTCFRLATDGDGKDVLEPLDGQGKPPLGDDGRPMRPHRQAHGSWPSCWTSRPPSPWPRASAKSRLTMHWSVSGPPGAEGCGFEGEAASIRLALGSGPQTLLLIDERAGRAVAEAFGIRLATAAAVIGMARQRRLIESARAVFAELQASDFRIAPAVVKAVLERCGE